MFGLSPYDRLRRQKRTASEAASPPHLGAARPDAGARKSVGPDRPRHRPYPVARGRADSQRHGRDMATRLRRRLPARRLQGARPSSTKSFRRSGASRL